MPVRVLKNVPDEGNQRAITLFSETREELVGKPVQQFALQEANRVAPGIRGFSKIGEILPVDANGETSVDLAMGRVKVAGYALTLKFSAAG